MVVRAQRCAWSRESSLRRPPVSVDADPSSKGERRNGADIWKVRIMVKGGELHHKETLNERLQNRPRDLFEHLHHGVRSPPNVIVSTHPALDGR